MTIYLLDTNVISMLAPDRIGEAAPFANWLERMDAAGRVFLSVVTIQEIEKGIALLESKGAKAKAAGLVSWLAGLISAYDDKILGIDRRVAAIAGRLEGGASAAGHHPGRPMR